MVEFLIHCILKWHLLKVAFFREWDSFFKSPNLQKKIIPKNYPKLEIWNFRPYQWTTYSNFKLRMVFWNNLFGRLGDLKNESHLWKKATFMSRLKSTFKTFSKSTFLQLSGRTPWGDEYIASGCKKAVSFPLLNYRLTHWPFFL